MLLLSFCSGNLLILLFCFKYMLTQIAPVILMYYSFLRETSFMCGVTEDHFKGRALPRRFFVAGYLPLSIKEEKNFKFFSKFFQVFSNPFQVFSNPFQVFSNLFQVLAKYFKFWPTYFKLSLTVFTVLYQPLQLPNCQQASKTVEFKVPWQKDLFIINSRGLMHLIHLKGFIMDPITHKY